MPAARARSAESASSTVLPMPASPVTSSTRLADGAGSTSSRSRVSPASRPTINADCSAGSSPELGMACPLGQCVWSTPSPRPTATADPACPQPAKCSNPADTAPRRPAATVVTGPGRYRCEHQMMRIAMPFVTVGRENSAAIRVYYEDHGSGSPVVLVHGYALNGHSWEKQEAALLAAGRRVITYDRRGCGASSRPSIGYDFDTLAGDLHILLSRLDLREVVLAGFAMGTGEVARYLAIHGPGRVTAAVLVAPLLPFLLKTDDNPDGIDRSVFDGLTARIAADRPAAMKDFMDRSYNVDLLGGSRVSDQAWQNSFYVAISASAHAALGCVTACLEDSRGNLAAISVPVLVIQGDQDRVLPYEATGSRLPALLNNARDRKSVV